MSRMFAALLFTFFAASGVARAISRRLGIEIRHDQARYTLWLIAVMVTGELGTEAGAV